MGPRRGHRNDKLAEERAEGGSPPVTHPSTPCKSRGWHRETLVRSCSELPQGITLANYPGDGWKGAVLESRFPAACPEPLRSGLTPGMLHALPGPGAGVRAPLRGPRLQRPGWCRCLHPLSRGTPAGTGAFEALFRIRAKCLK